MILIQLSKHIWFPLLSIGLLISGCSTSEKATEVAKQQPAPITNNGTSTSPANESAKVGTEVGNQAPKFELRTLDGKTLSFPTASKNPTVLYFWASWCGYCQQEAPDLVALAKKYKGKVEFYGVNTTARDDVEAANDYVQNYKIDFPTLLDMNGDVVKQYKLQGTPTSFFIDENGVIVDHHIGSAGKESLEASIQKIAK